MTRRPHAAPALYGLVTLFLASSLLSCASGPKTPDAERGQNPTATPAVAGPIAPPKRAAGTAAAASPAEERDYREIYTLYSRAAYEAAILKLQAFARAYPQSPLTSQAENLFGLSFLLTKRPLQAIPHFRRAIEEGGTNPAFAQYLGYNLATAQFEAGQIDEARKTAMALETESMDKDNRVKVHYLRARIHSLRAEHAEAARECLAAGRLLMPASARETRNAVATQLEQSLKNIGDPSALENLYRGYEDSSLADAVLFRLGSIEVAASDAPELRAKGEAHLRTLMSRYPDSAYYAQAAELARGASANKPATGAATASRDTGPVRSRTVGVLLPMRGKFAKFGARNLQGIELAFRIFNTAEPDSKVTLVVEDSGDEAETAVRALDKLVTRHHAVAVIGPLLSKGIDQVTTRAGELGVPLLSLARNAGIQNDYVFQAGLTLRLQAREIARFAIETLGMKRFAIVYPRDKVGEDSMQKFWDSVDAFGGSIQGVESYNPGETDFRQVVDRLSGLYYSEARSRELEQLARDREANQIKKRTRKTEQYYTLKPIIDYDAVFIPEEPKAAGQLMPTFAYRDVDKVKFLGTSAWNSPELAARAGTAAEKAYFLDAFFPESQSPATRKYVERYKATFGQDPSAMDALAYDAASLLESVIAKHGELNREELRDRLKEVKGFPGVTGRISYGDGQLARDLKILTVDDGKVVEAGAEPGGSSASPSSASR